MHQSLDSNGVDDSDLDCLIMWPKNTQGEASDRLIIAILNALCKKHGYGRIPQLAQQIEDIWRNPEKLEQYKKEQAAHREFMAETVKEIKKRGK